MTNTTLEEKILAALQKVEHPAIATTLQDLGILGETEIDAEGNVIFTLVLPFPNIPDNVRDMMVNQLAAAAQSAGGQVTKVRVGIMDDVARQTFLEKEQQNWRG